MITQKKFNYNGKVLIYDKERSQGMIVPIYKDIDGQLYMPLNECFVTVCDVIAVLENYHRNVMLEVI